MNIKFRKAKIRLIIGLLFTICFNGVQSQNNPSDSAIIKMLRDFYTSYMKEFTDVSSDSEKRLVELQKKYCTSSLVSRVPKLADKIDSDPFLNAQDSDSTWAKSLHVIKDAKKPGVFVVSYLDGGNTKVIIHLLVVKQKVSYKISDVW